MRWLPVLRQGSVWRGCALAALVLAISGPGWADQHPLTLEEVVKNLVAVNASLQSFQVEQIIDARVLIFRIRLLTTVYAARPARYRVVVHNPPWFLRSIGTVFAHVGRPEDLPVLYTSRTIAWRDEGGRRLLYLDLTKQLPNVNPPQVEMLVDPRRWLAEKMVLHYDWGDVVAEYRYGPVGDFLLPVEIHVRIVGYAISAVATYQNYQLNIPIADSIFAGD